MRDYTKAKNSLRVDLFFPWKLRVLLVLSNVTILDTDFWEDCL